MKIRSTISGEVFIEVVERDSLSNLLISELMITYNCKVAEFLKNHKIPGSYKVQKSPDFNGFDKIPDTILDNFKVGKFLRPALYSRSPGWHFGLGVNAYTQASSPLRRYSDLCIQRQLIQFIDNGNHVYSEDEISSICHSVEAQKKNLSLIEKSRTRYWFLKYLKDNYLSHNKTIMEAIALEDGSDNRTAFELIKYPHRGKCIFNNEIKAGQIVSINLSGIDLWERSAQFSYVK
jgi:exoribonuclease-2